MPEKLGHYRPNPAYGTGIARRRVHLRASDGRVSARLYDNFHEMIVELSHDGTVVTAITGAMPRFPKTTCPGAIGHLSQFLGARIADGREVASRSVARRDHCSHLLDLALFSISLLQRGETERLFEVAVTDRTPEGRQDVTATLDGVPALIFSVAGEVIAEPAQWRGVAMFGGFGRWVSSQFAGVELDLWIVAQMTMLISQGRAFLTDGPEPLPVSRGLHRKDACYSFSEPRFSEAWDCIDTVRDLTSGLPPLADQTGSTKE